MADSLTREQRAMLEGFGRSAAEMLGKRPQPSLKVARGYIAEAGECSYDVLMPDGAVLEEVPCLVSALGGTAGDEVRVEWVQGRALVTGVVATPGNIPDDSGYVTLLSNPVLYMGTDQVALLSEPVSEQRTGIVLVWDWYDTASGTPFAVNMLSYFIPKTAVAELPGKGWRCSSIGGDGNMAKYVYVHDDRIEGYSTNTTNGTIAGIQVKNGSFVLRYVYGM